MRVHRIHGRLSYSHLIEAEGGLVLVDVGFTGHGQRVLERISRLGRDPSEIRLCVLTHGHVDHFAALPELLAVADFPIAIHPEHVEIVQSGTLDVSPGRSPYGRAYSGVVHRIQPHVPVPAISPLIPLADGARLDEWGLSGRVLHTPGHSAGCMSVLLDSGLAFVGDTIQGPRLRRVGPVEPPSMAVDPARALASWRRLIDEGAETFFPGHGGVFGREQLERRLAHERAKHPEYRLHDA